MSKPTTEDILSHLKQTEHLEDELKSDGTCRYCQAIRALILAVEGWKKLAGKHENLVNLKAVSRFLCDIRDFGEEKK